MDFSYLKTALKIDKKKCKNNIVKTAGNIAKSSKFQPKALHISVLKGMILVFTCTENFFFLFKIGYF